jgi:hypothetical protein
VAHRASGDRATVMAQEPFLLDPRYKGALDGDAFRRRYLKINRSRWWVDGVAFLVPLPFLLPSLIVLLVGRANHDPEQIETGMGLAWIAVVPALFAAFVLVVRQFERAYHRRFAFRSVRVPGKTVTCLRKYYSHGEDSDGEYVVEVVYTARGPSGADLRGVKGLPRDDLLNAPLPPPGTPVVVLVLNDRHHTVL